MPIFDPDGKCPLLQKKCIKHQCLWYNMLQGKHPQTGLDVSEWGCSIAWLPLLLVENSAKLNGVQAATESFRNEMVKGQTAMNKLLQSNDSAKNLAMNATSIFELIGNHQKAIEKNDPKIEDETIRQLSNNKVKVKKGKKDGNNRK
jgi:aldehyde:ferredoxin oxidoreductase